MGFGNKNNSSGKKTSKYVNLGSVYSKTIKDKKGNDLDVFYLALDNFNGDVVFQTKDGEVMQLKYLSFFTPRKSPNSNKSLPKNLHYTVALNLENPTGHTKLGHLDDNLVSLLENS